MFIDATGREIKIAEGFNCIEAYHSGQKIGSIEFDEIETD